MFCNTPLTPPEKGIFTIDPQKTHQTVQDFGASVCWWATGIGTQPIAEQFLTMLYTPEGLGLNVLRFNAGGGMREDRSDSCSPNTLSRAPLSPLKEDGTYDITRDNGTLTLVQKALQLGTITDFTLFMNSPPSTMTISGMTCARRPEEGEQYVSNLREDCYEAYAQYVADVTEAYINAGIPVKYVSPVNEPQWQWDDRNHQEGCHYTPEECIRIFKLVIEALKVKAAQNPAMADVRISMPETAQWWQNTYVHDMYKIMCEDPEIRPWVDHFSAHSYGTNADSKRTTRAYFDSLGIDIPLHQTEWAPLHADFTDNMDFALELATVLWEDMTILHTRHWTWWLGVGGHSWPDGLVAFNGSTQEYTLPKRYFVMMHHSRFIRNYTNVDVSKADLPEGVNASAYLSPDGKELVVIAINPGNEVQTVGFSGIDAKVAKVYETSQTLDCAYLGTLDTTKGYILPARSVTNLIFKLK